LVAIVVPEAAAPVYEGRVFDEDQAEKPGSLESVAVVKMCSGTVKYDDRLKNLGDSFSGDAKWVTCLSTYDVKEASVLGPMERFPRSMPLRWNGVVMIIVSYSA